MSRSHIGFLARTVLVKNNDIEVAYRALDRVLRNDGIIEQARRNVYYEKPCQMRRRLMFERQKRIYNEQMDSKIQFLMRKNRTNPWLR